MANEFTPLIKNIDGVDYTNGNMPMDALVGITHNNDIRYVYIEAERSLQRIIIYLNNNKIKNSSGDPLDFKLEAGYRPLGKPGDFERLEEPYIAKNLERIERLTGFDVAEEKTQYYTYEFWLKTHENFAMNPGTSVHGWGLAIDVYEYPKLNGSSWYGGGFIPGKSQKSISGPWKNGPIQQDSFQKWLKENGSKWGWNWKGLDYGEAWHFEYDPANDPSRGPKITLNTNNNIINYNTKPKNLNLKRKIETITNKQKQEIMNWLNSLEKKVK